MSFFCLIIGCNSNFNQHSDGVVRVCPNCHNASIVGGQKKTFLEVCFIPLSFLPISNKQIWLCPICNWHLDADRGEPQRVGAPQGQYYSPGPGGRPPPQPGYGYGVGSGHTPSGIMGGYPGQGR